MSEDQPNNGKREPFRTHLTDSLRQLADSDTVLFSSSGTIMRDFNQEMARQREIEQHVHRILVEQGE